MTEPKVVKRGGWWARVKDELTPRRDLLLLKLVLTLHMSGLSIMLPFLIPFTLQLGITYNELAIIFAFQPISAIIGPPIAGMIADKTGRYKLVVMVTILLCAVTTVLMLYIPARAPVPSLTLTCHDGGHRLTWDSCDLCHTQRNNTFLQLQLQNCEAECVPSPDNFEMCFTGNLNTSCILLNSGAEVTVNGTVMTVEDNNTCGHIWTEVRHDSRMYRGLNCPAPDPCPVRCQVAAPPPCTPPDDPSNSPATFWICFVHRIWWRTFILSGYAMMTAVTMSIIKERGAEYGKQRALPLIANSIAPFLAGSLVDWYSRGQDQSDYTIAAYMSALFYIITVALVTRLEFTVEKSQKRMLKDLRRLVTTVKVDAFLIYAFILGTNWGFQESYIYVYLKSLDAPNSMLGLTVSSSTVTAVPVVFLSDKILNTFGFHPIVIFGFFLHFLTNFIYPFIRNPWLVVVLYTVKPLGFNLQYMGMARICPRLAPKGLLATMTALMDTTTFSFGLAAGSSLGGVLAGSLGLTRAFRTFAYMNLGCVSCYTALYFLYIRRHYGSDKGDKSPKASEEVGMTEEEEETEKKKDVEKKGDELKEKEEEEEEATREDEALPMLTATHAWDTSGEERDCTTTLVNTRISIPTDKGTKGLEDTQHTSSSSTHT